MMSATPAEIAGLTSQGRLEVGAAANLVVFDPKGAANTTSTVSRSSNSPYLGRDRQGAVRHTIYRGRFSVLNGEPVELAGAVG